MSNVPTRSAPQFTPGRLFQVTLLFLIFSTIAFGGSAAHITLMREEVVEHREWIDDQQFLDLLGATNLIRGRSSTEVAIHIGYERRGCAGRLSPAYA